MTANIDIYRTTNELIKPHGDDAPIHAAMRVDELLDAGDRDGQAVWKRVIGTLAAFVLWIGTVSNAVAATDFGAECKRLAANKWEQLAGSGYGVDPKNINSAAAVTACAKAVQSDPQSAIMQYRLGRALFAKGDYAVAFEWYRRAAKQGLAVAQSNLAFLYSIGKGVRKNDKTAVKWYTLAAEQGLAVAQYNLGIMYKWGEGVPRNNKIAVKWLTPAAIQGLAFAQSNLGYMYQWGLGVRRNYKTALTWHRLAAKQGNLFAQSNLGYMYHKGRGVPQNDKTAIKWYTLAAEQGFVPAQSNLGLIYGSGIGPLQDVTRAHMWWNIAASQGSKIARRNRDIAEKIMSTTQLKTAQRLARECVKKNYKGC